jgi:hypothetical protein
MLVAMPSAAALLDVWEAGGGEHPIDRALTILAAFTGASRAELAALGVHRRDALLVRSRIAAFGPTLGGVATCAACGCEAELTLELVPPADELADDGSLEVDGRSVRYRAPTSVDLAAAAACAHPDDAADLLRTRCITADALDARATVAAEAALEALCAPAEITLAGRCPACDAPFAPAVDIASILWRELALCAARLLDEVVALAARYGWSEAEILAIPDRRRQYYLEALG